MAERDPDQHERSAAGLDFDDGTIRDKAEELGAKMMEGPEALLDEIENLLPEAWREQIRAFPVAGRHPRPRRRHLAGDEEERRDHRRRQLPRLRRRHGQRVGR